MRHPALRWLVILYTFAWFGILVPAHQRGQFQLPGRVSVSDSCCASKDKSHPGSPADKNKPVENCAVCYFVATLDVPPPVIFVESRAALLGAIEAEAAASVVAARLHLPCRERAPPLV